MSIVVGVAVVVVGGVCVASVGVVVVGGDVC